MTRTCLSLLAIAILLATPTAVRAVTLAEWDFNEGSGTAANSSVGGYTGNLVGFADTTAGAGDPVPGSGWTSDGQLNFDFTPAVPTRVETTFPYSTISGTSFTIEYIGSHNNAVQGWSPYFGQSTGTCCFFFGKRSGESRLHTNLNGLGGQDSTWVPVADGRPHHIALVFDDVANTQRTYFDHALVGVTSGHTGTLNSGAIGNMWFGAVGHQPANEQWNGKVGHVRISDTVLTPAQFLASPASLPVLSGLGTPTPGDPRLKAWYKADDGVVLNGSNVAQWVDRSVVTPDPNRDLFSTDLTHAPTFKASEGTLGGAPAVSFDGGLQFLQRQNNGNPAANNSPVIGNSDRTVFVVLSNTVPRPGTNNIEHALHFGNTANDESYGVLTRAAGGNFGNHYWSGIDGGTTASTPDPTAVTFVYDNDGSGGGTGLDSFFVDGVAAGTIDAATTVTNGIMKTGMNEFKVGARIGLSGGNPVEHFQGDIAEIIIYDAQLTQQQINQVHGYLQLKYGIQIEGAVIVPEPSSIALSLLGLSGIALVAVRRRRRR